MDDIALERDAELGIEALEELVEDVDEELTVTAPVLLPAGVSGLCDTCGAILAGRNGQVSELFLIKLRRPVR
jgi:hypothetical protein